MAPRPAVALAAMAVGACCVLGACARVSSPDTELEGQGAPPPEPRPSAAAAGVDPVGSVAPRSHAVAGAASEPPPMREEAPDVHAQAAPPSDPVAVISVPADPQGLPLPAPAPPRTTLRATPAGEMPVFDPDAVYIKGWSEETADSGSHAIASVEVPDDSVGEIDYFDRAWVRADGRLLYQDGNLAVREFIRDALPTVWPEGKLDAPWHDGELIHPSSLPCEPNETVQTSSRRYLLGLEGNVLHTCGFGDSVAPPETDSRTWYAADGTPVFEGELWPLRLGAQQRLLGMLGSALIVVDLESGQELGQIEVGENAVVAVRAREDGFLVALLGASLNDRVWLDLDLEGSELARGSFAPLPEGLHYVVTGNSWASRTGALDAAGRLYEFVGEGDSPVVVRRPRGAGVSDVPYREEDSTHASPTTIWPEVPTFITGG